MIVPRVAGQYALLTVSWFSLIMARHRIYGTSTRTPMNTENTVSLDQVIFRTRFQQNWVKLVFRDIGIINAELMHKE